MSQSAYAKRAEVVSKIPNFWPLVVERAPPEIDQFIQPQDSQIIAESLLNVEVTRPEIAVGPENIASGKQGNPKTISITKTFKPNDFFSNTTLTKTFHQRRAKNGWTGLVSEPVKIDWKKGKDLSEGLTDMAVALFESRKKTGDFLAKGLPEYTALKKKVETANGMNTSFFTWFGFVSSHRYVSAEESAKADEEFAAKKAERGAGKAAAEQEAQEDEDEEDEEDDSEVEVHEAGEELAIALADDLWPGAIRYFTEAQEMDGMSEMDFEEMEDDSDEGEPVDIRALVQDKGGKGSSRKTSGSGAPPSKKQKK